MSAGADYDRSRLFWIGVLALFTAALAFSLRAAVADELRSLYLVPLDPTHSFTLIAEALGASFLGFAVTLFACCALVDVIGMKRLIMLAALGFIGGTLLIAFCGMLGTGYGVYWVMLAGMVLQGMSWGFVEATINPMTAALYPEDTTHRMNVLHAWWPAGLIVGGLWGLAVHAMELHWRIALVLILLPAFVFAALAITARFPETRRVKDGISFGDMLREVFRRPSFFIWFGAMFLTAASELAPGQWVDLALTRIVGMRGIVLLIYVSGLMFVMRHFAGPLAHRLSPTGLLLASSALTAIGLYLLGIANSPFTALVAATVWGAGVCFIWPTMLAAAADNYPRAGAWGIGLIGTAGALSIYFVLPRLGALYDRAKLEAAGGAEQLALLSGPEMDRVLAEAARVSFHTVAILPMILIGVFGGLWLHARRSRSQASGYARPESSHSTQ
ncbi:MFS transporter [Steroidobacter sp.]|uniref:MFS transporter n=1 Tax=Steroidobacter sp. TaxID=1978227 RepID=UPI001A556FA7|nr:MFS transporter [Steroidobacter sp.]MBL8269196.1 MFS transporter [Steroidobacter sp.]